MENILNIARDVAVVGYMFVLRIVVPLLIIWMYGNGLRKWLQERDEREEQAIEKPEQLQQSHTQA